MPLTYAHLITFFVAQMLYNVYGHLGWELYPCWFARHRFGKRINTSVNHNQHHQFFKGNYGLYFLWWDRWMGTIRAGTHINNTHKFILSLFNDIMCSPHNFSPSFLIIFIILPVLNE